MGYCNRDGGKDENNGKSNGSGKGNGNSNSKGKGKGNGNRNCNSNSNRRSIDSVWPKKRPAQDDNSIDTSNFRDRTLGTGH